MRGIQKDRLGRRRLTAICISMMMGFAAMNAFAAPGDINTFAGGGLGLGGSGSIISTDTLVNPGSVAIDGSGNIYAADSGNNRIRKKDTSGVISTIAGTGNLGSSGDGGPARWAELRTPESVATSGGDVYIADTGSNKVRKVDGSGNISNVAGTGTMGFSGDGGAATAGTLNKPNGIAFDSLGNLYIADSGNNRIRKVDTSGTISTIAGGSDAGFTGDGGPASSALLSYPTSLTFDASDNIFIADRENMRIRKITAATGIITTIAGDGYVTPVSCFGPNPGNGVEFNCDDTRFGRYNGDGIAATSASLNLPWGVAVDASGNVFIADAYNHRIRKVDTSGMISTVAGTGTAGFTGDGGPAVSAQVNRPYGVTTSGTSLYISDTINDRIRVIDALGTINSVFGLKNSLGCCYDTGLSAGLAILSNPQDVFASGGETFIADAANHRVVKIDSGGVVSTVAGKGIPGFSGDGGAASAATLYKPTGVVKDSGGNLYIADLQNFRVRKIDPSGVITTVAGTGVRTPASPAAHGDGGPATSANLYPVRVAVDSAGDLLIADPYNNRIRKVSASTGIISTVAGVGTVGGALGGYSGDGGSAAAAQLNAPSDVVGDSAGNVFIADRGNSRIRKVSGGTISTVAGNGNTVPVPAPKEAGGAVPALGDGGPAVDAALAYPNGVEVDGSGNLYISDSWNVRIRKVDAGGTINTIAGNGCLPLHPNVNGRGVTRYSCTRGDGGPAKKAALLYPAAVAISGANLLVAEGIFTSPHDYAVGAASLAYSSLGFYQNSSWNRIRIISG